jgi:DNA-binding NtrC family response regulator
VREEAERNYILSILNLTKGHRAEAARLLGISRKTLWKKLKQLGLS